VVAKTYQADKPPLVGGVKSGRVHGTVSQICRSSARRKSPCTFSRNACTSECQSDVGKFGSTQVVTRSNSFQEASPGIGGCPRQSRSRSIFLRHAARSSNPRVNLRRGDCVARTALSKTVVLVQCRSTSSLRRLRELRRHTLTDSLTDGINRPRELHPVRLSAPVFLPSASSQ